MNERIMDVQNEIPVFVQPHFNGRTYANFVHEQHTSFLGRSIFMFLTSWLKRIGKKPIFPQQVSGHSSLASGPVHITWIGHSTFLIQYFGKTIVTDPIFGNASWLFPRMQPPGLTVSQLPHIDYILISHNHRDHMDAKTLHALAIHKPVILVPKGDKQWFDRRGFERVYEATWWQPFTFTHELDPIIFTFLPALHWSQRGLKDRNHSLWGSWMIEHQGFTVYFGGDSAYWHHFGQISKKFPHIDVALLPIGPCEPRQWLQAHHMSAQEAGQAFLDLQAHHFIPMHWGTFYFGVDEPLLPVQRLQQWWNMHAIQTKTLHVASVGHTLHFDRFVRPEQSSVAATKEK